jgi:Domain of unknown function (DUF6993)
MARRLGITAVLAFAGAAILVGVTGCTAPAPVPTATPSSSARPTPSALPAPVIPDVPALRPELSADQNLEYFDSVNVAVVAANGSAGGRDFIDALVAAGFDKSQMEVTADRTSVDLQADSVLFAIRFQGECLVGQYGPSSGGYHGAVRPMLGTGRCLVGQTRPIDW